MNMMQEATPGDGGGVPVTVDVPSASTLDTLYSNLSISAMESGIEATALGLITVAALVGNVSLWIIVLRERSLRVPSNALVLCLSSADLLVSAVNMPVIMVAIVEGGWPLSHASCVVLGFITMTAFVASVMSLAAISINRYFNICHPNKFKALFTPKNTSFFVLGVWILSLSLAIPPLLGWAEYDYLPGQSVCFCNWRSSISYTFFMVGVCFGGPCSVMSFCYFNILRIVRESKRKIQTATSLPIPKGYPGTDVISKTTGELASTPVKNNQGMATLEVPRTKAQQVFMTYQQKKARAKRQEEIKLATSFLVIILVFVFCWLPFCITMFMNVFMDEPVPRLPDMLTLLLGCANSACNPIIYGIMNKRFRDGYKKLYCFLCVKLKVVHPQTSLDNSRTNADSNSMIGAQIKSNERTQYDVHSVFLTSPTRAVNLPITDNDNTLEEESFVQNNSLDNLIPPLDDRSNTARIPFEHTPKGDNCSIKSSANLGLPKGTKILTPIEYQNSSAAVHIHTKNNILIPASHVQGPVDQVPPPLHRTDPAQATISVQTINVQESPVRTHHPNPVPNIPQKAVLQLETLI